MTVPSIGTLLPHFGSTVSRDALDAFLEAAVAAGLTSLWARDHLVYTPHGIEDPEPTFLETFTTLGYAAHAAPTMDLGTAAVVPIRHPLVLAKALSSLAALTRGRILLGFGAGFRDEEFAAVGLQTDLAQRAREVVPETFRVLDAYRRGEPPTYQGEHYDPFGPVAMQPPLPTSARLLYCGISPLSLRLAVEHAEGWVPGRITYETLLKRRQSLPEDAPADLDIVAIPLVVLADSRAEAERRMDVDALLAYANGHRWLEAPGGGEFRTSRDLEGIVLYGSPDDIRSGIDRFAELGATQVVLDMRLDFAEAPNTIAGLAEVIGATEEQPS